MQTRRGFTIVELVVVMVIMTILLTISGLTLGSSRAKSRDTERATDTEAIARGLELRYAQGKINTGITTTPSWVAAGAYPGTDEMSHIMGNSVSGFTPAQIVGGYGPIALPGTTINSFSPPTVTSGSYGGFTLSTCSIAVENLSSGSCLDGLVTKGTYVYEPINASGALCAQSGCVRFNLYWRNESGTNPPIQTIRSKHQ